MFKVKWPFLMLLFLSSEVFAMYSVWVSYLGFVVQAYVPQYDEDYHRLRSQQALEYQAPEHPSGPVYILPGDLYTISQAFVQSAFIPQHFMQGGTGAEHLNLWHNPAVLSQIMQNSVGARAAFSGAGSMGGALVSTGPAGAGIAQGYSYNTVPQAQVYNSPVFRKPRADIQLKYCPDMDEHGNCSFTGKDGRKCKFLHFPRSEFSKRVICMNGLLGKCPGSSCYYYHVNEWQGRQLLGWIFSGPWVNLIICDKCHQSEDEEEKCPYLHFEKRP
ncbi:MAG: hypothetical protein ACR2PT_09800 [Endozoicomonas sp.]